MENILSKIKEEFLTKFSENPFLMTIEKQAYFELPIYACFSIVIKKGFNDY